MRKFWASLGEGRQNEILGVLFVTFAIILFLALITYSPDDPGPFSRSSKARVDILIGIPGAWLSDFVFEFFGRAGYLIPFLVLIACFAWLKRRPAEAALRRLLGVIFTISCACGLLSMYVSSDSGVAKSGGIFGFGVAVAASYLGRVGGGIVLFALFFVGLLVATEVRLNTLVRWGRLFSLFVLRQTANGAGFIKTRLAEKQGYQRTTIKKPSHKPRLRDGNVKEEKEEDEEKKSEKPNDKKKPAPKKKRVRAVFDDPQPDLEIQFGEEPPKDAFENVPQDEPYKIPPLSLLDKGDDGEVTVPMEEIEENSRVLERTLEEFDIEAKVVGFQRGPVITRYELELAPGIKVNKITNLTDNLSLSLAASPIRVLAPIPGRSTVGIEVPNKDQKKVYLKALLDNDDFRDRSGKLTLAFGQTLSGEMFYADLNQMPHLLIAGATGSGKSVCINTIITSILYKATPKQVKFLMIDPKRVELKIFENIPHLMAPVVSDSRRAGAALKWVVEEMEDRFRMLERINCRDIASYNKKMVKQSAKGELSDGNAITLKPFLPYIVVLIDELADLMTTAKKDTEVLIARLAQKARAVGIHLVIATQRPSVNVITGVIKANFPSRIAFQVASKVDSRTILDSNGAEALLGRGDMLFSSATSPRAVRLQGSFVTTEEIERVCEHIKAQTKPEYLAKDFSADDEGGKPSSEGFSKAKQSTMFDIPLPSELEAENTFSKDVDLFDMAKQVVIETGSASTSLLQRRLKIGYGRAARFLDQMEQEGIVGPPRGSRPREVLVAPPDEDDEEEA